MATPINIREKVAPGKDAVVHMTSVHSPTDVRIFRRECRTLAGSGYAVTLIAPADDDRAVDGVSIRAVARPGNRLVRMTRTLWQVYRQAVRQNAAVYHFHDPELIPVGLLLRLHGKAVIYDMHENVSHQILGGEDKKWIPRWLRRPISLLFAALERMVAPRFSAIVTANTEISRWAEHLNRRVVLIGNYPEADEFRSFIADPGRYSSGRIANFGGISHRTCTRQVVQALGELSDTLPATMILAGAPTANTLSSALEAMPGWSRVSFVGAQSRQRILQELRRAAMAIVLFSPSPNSYGVGSNRFYEALAAGLPVIVSNFPQWRAMIDRLGCGLYVDPMNPSAIAKAIEYLLTHPDEAARMGHCGRQAFLNEYSWDSEQPKLLNLYQQLTAA